MLYCPYESRYFKLKYTDAFHGLCEQKSPPARRRALLVFTTTPLLPSSLYKTPLTSVAPEIEEDPGREEKCYSN
jgi:hypothetical protein